MEYSNFAEKGNVVYGFYRKSLSPNETVRRTISVPGNCRYTVTTIDLVSHCSYYYSTD